MNSGNGIITLYYILLYYLLCNEFTTVCSLAFVVTAKYNNANNVISRCGII